MDSRIKILFLAANPTELSRLRLDRELREIDGGLRRSSFRDRFELVSRWAVRSIDLRRAFLEVAPGVVHFCGHGMTGGIALEDEKGKTVAVHDRALSALSEAAGQDARIVVLNSCHSERQAVVINQHIAHVIGIKGSIDDAAAIHFAVGFYDGLGAGRSVDDAFKLGVNDLRHYNIPRHLMPVFKFNSAAPAFDNNPSNRQGTVAPAEPASSGPVDQRS